MESVTLSHLGGADGVTGSCHLLQVSAEHSLMIDCGLFQGMDAERVSSGLNRPGFTGDSKP